MLEGKKDVAPNVSADEAAYRSAVMEALYLGVKEHTWVEPVQAGGKN